MVSGLHLGNPMTAGDGARSRRSSGRWRMEVQEGGVTSNHGPSEGVGCEAPVAARGERRGNRAQRVEDAARRRRGRWWRSSRQRSLARPGCLLVVGSYGRDEPQAAALGAPVLEARISKRHRRKGRPEETLGGRRGREIERDSTLTVSWRREGVRGEATGTSGEG